jgi:hypothetical protein
MWFNLDCSGSPKRVDRVPLKMDNGGAVVGCLEGNPHKFGPSGVSAGRRLDAALSTEYKILGAPSTLTDSSANTVKDVHVILRLIIAAVALLVANGY